jgi:hypothetical protein
MSKSQGEGWGSDSTVAKHKQNAKTNQSVSQSSNQSQSENNNMSQLFYF